MADEQKEAVYHQSSFLGGEWTPLARGRSDDKGYKTALAVNINAISMEEGAWVRRSGTRTLGPTAGRSIAKLLPFQSSAGDPYVMEFTDGTLQFYGRKGRVCTNDAQVVTTSSVSGGHLFLAVGSAHGWSVNDAVILWAPATLNSGITIADVGPWLNRVFTVHTVVSSTVVALSDDLDATFSFSPPNDAFTGFKMYRLKRYTTPYVTPVLHDLRAVQAREHGIILSYNTAPTTLSIVTEAGATDDSDPLFSTLDAVPFVDGPYLDPQGASPDVHETGTVSGPTGTISFTPATTTFVASDVGRLIRLWSEPAAWNSGTTYSYGDTVTYGGEWWVSIATDIYASSNVGVIPGTIATVSGTSVTLWAPNGDAGRWAWGAITAQAATTCTVVLHTDLNSANGNTITKWCLGVYQGGQYPTCGVYHEGRLWLAGAVNNRVDASKSNDIFNFSPTDVNGFVADDNAIAAEFNFDDVQIIYWLMPDPQGILVGTAGGEILITASQLNDPITPSSRQANKISAYKCANVEARRVGSAIIYVQRYRRHLMEMLADGLTGKFGSRPLNVKSKHLSVAGFREIAYQAETVPTIWAIDDYGHIIGTTYRRLSKFIDNEPEAVAGHRHFIGDGNRIVASMCVVPSSSGLGDSLYLCTCTIAPDDYAVEILEPPIKEE